jgi:TRAP-type C4-dicarboxylate transport system substrate-binding protein
MNQRKWNSLTPEQQQILTEAADETLNWTKEEYPKEEAKLVADLESKMKEAYQLPQDEWQRWSEKVKPLYDKYISDNGEDAAKLLEIRDKLLQK